MSIIEPIILKGFRDFLPDEEQRRREILTKLEKVVRSYGFVAIDTPILEYTEVLLGKGGGETDKQVFHFKDGGDRDVAMRFDLTVPFARYMAAHLSEVYLPFKRFHFAKVWRGEKPQRGRYREFMQCDFDIVGVDSASADFEILVLMHRTFSEMGVKAVRFHISHRGIFNRFLDSMGVRDKSVEILRTVDKVKKIGEEETLKLLTEIVPASTAARIVEYIKPAGLATDNNLAAINLETLKSIETLSGGVSEDSTRMRDILSLANELGIAGNFYLDPSITRGLDYYTGIVYETFLTDLPAIGSVCSGGRYNNLAGLYTKEELPGVGSSIGLDRLIAGLEELGLLSSVPRGADIIVLCQDEKFLGYYHRIAASFREAGFNVEVYPQAKKLPAQFQYAEKKSIPWGIIAGQAEFDSGTINLRDLRTRESFDKIGISDAIIRIRG